MTAVTADQKTFKDQTAPTYVLHYALMFHGFVCVLDGKKEINKQLSSSLHQLKKKDKQVGDSQVLVFSCIGPTVHQVFDHVLVTDSRLCFE